MEIQNLPLKSIKPYWRNPRKNEGAVEAVRQSIERFGFAQPLVVDKDYVIIAGHTRYLALARLGWAEVPCVVLDLPPSKAKEYRIVDNKSGELAEWNMDFLIPELREVDPSAMQIYFPDLDIDKLLRDTGGAGYQSPTDGEIGEAGARLGSAMRDLATRNADGMVEVTCPHCAKSFGVDRAAVERELEGDAKARAGGKA